METKTSKKSYLLQVSYGKEPFDLRLTVLRLMRNLPKILLITLIGTVLFGGIYYVKNVMLPEGPVYITTSTYKVSYAVEPTQSGDYYINEMTWNTYVHSDEFVEAVFAHLQENSYNHDVGVESAYDLIPMIQAKLDSDVHVPSTIVTALSFSRSLELAEAVEQTITEDFVENNEQVTAIKVIDRKESMESVLAKEQPRPTRALILAAVLSGFFAVVFFLLREIGNDAIWLPATLRRRYGLSALGTVNSPELAGNLEYTFRERQKIAVCAVSDECNPVEITEVLKQKLEDASGKSDKPLLEDNVWIPIPAPMLCPEAGEVMRSADGVLLVVEAGSHTGRSLEYVLEYLAAQEIEVTAALLWDADEGLIKAYYMIPETKEGMDLL